MCGRYTATGGVSELDARLDVSSGDVASALERYNVAPRQKMAVVERAEDGTRAARTARWGLLPRWAKTSKDRLQPINARSDKMLDSRLWKPLLGKVHHRVLIPADGWYEWLHSEDKQKTRPAPFRHLVDGGGFFAFAGLVETTTVEDRDEPLTTATIITTASSGPASRLHDRMPVVLAGPDEEAAWLSPDLGLDDLMALLRPLADDRVSLHPASRRVNAVKNEGPALLDPANEVEEA